MKPKNEDDVRKYYKLQYQTIMKELLPVLYSMNNDNDKLEEPKITPRIEYRS